MRIRQQKINPRNYVIETDLAFIHVDLVKTFYTIEPKGANPYHRYNEKHYKDVTRVETYRRQVSEQYRQLLELVEVDL